MAEKVKVVNIDTNPASVSVKDLKQQLKQLKDTMLSVEQGTDEYNSALQKAANIQHTLKEQMEEVNANAMDFGQIAGNVTKSVGGIVAGFQAATATMNLFGVENEDVMKSLQKMQNLMALTQSFSGIDGGIKSFKRLSLAIQGATGATSKFSKALISTGLGALAVALGYIITNFDEISGWLDKITGQTNVVGKVSDTVIAGLNAGWTAVKGGIMAVGNAIVTYITAPFQSIVAMVTAFQNTEGSLVDKLQAAGKAAKEKFVGEWKEVGDNFKQVGTDAANAFNEKYEERQEDRRKKEIEKEREQAKKIADEKAKELAEYRKVENEKLNIELERLKRQEISEKEALKKQIDIETERLKLLDKNTLAYEQQLTKIADLRKEYNDLSKPTERDYDAERNSLKIQNNIFILNLEERYNLGIIKEEEYNAEKLRLQQDYLNKYINSLQTQLDAENLNADERLKIEEQIAQAKSQLAGLLKPEDEEGIDYGTILSNNIKLLGDTLTEVSENPAWGKMMDNFAQLSQMAVQLSEDIKNGGKDAWGSYLNIASVAFSGISNMLDGLASEQDASNKEGFESAKKMQIASATMTTLSSVLQALAAGNSMASQMGLAAPIGWAMGAAMATMVGTMGAINIAKIAQQKFGGSSTGVSATPSASAVNVMQAPVQYTQDVQGTSIEDSIRNQRVYVLESDITTTQEKVSVVEAEALF